MTITRTLVLHDAREELPEKSGEVLVYIAFTVPYLLGGSWAHVNYSTKHRKFNAHDESRPKSAIEVTYWAELPEMPRDDRTEETHE